LNSRQLAAYRRAETDGIVQLRAHGQAIRITHVLELIMRLKQICNFDPVSGESAKIADIRERMAVLAEEGHRALIFSQFVNLFGVETAVDRLREFSPLALTGSLDMREREMVVRRFKERDKHKALILSLRAGGAGLNLQEASYVFHLDRWWNPAVERQAEDRAHRMGQQFPVTVYKYVCTNTIEERIDRLIAGKQELFDDLVDDVSLDIASVLTSREIFGLFGLEPPLAQKQPQRSSGQVLADRCASFLRACGWAIAPTPAHYGRFDILSCHDTDVTGFSQSLEIWCANGVARITLEDVRTVLARTSSVEGEVAIAFTADISENAAALARRSSVRIWDSKTVERFDHLSER